ncbi:unnamed protein product [Rotaria sp. Silwood2]|nr:unnamed protein product [Rotaria sp. Silwood2]
MGKPVSPDLSKVESDSIHRQRRVQSPSSQHEHSSITSSSQPDTSKAELPIEEVTLKRHLGLFSGVCFIVGIIIGSGIFVSPKNVLKDTKSVGFCLIVWAVCGLLALLGALCYAEIGTVIPRNGAEIAYLKEGTVKNPSGVALSFYAGLWAYDGWNSLNTVTEELKNPQRNLWLSIVLALPAVTVLYVLTNISYFTVLSKAAMLSSNVVAVTWGEAVLWHQAVRVLLILISISALGSANGTLFAAARYCMVGAQYGYLPEVFACIHSKRLTPLPGIVLQVILISHVNFINC